MKPELQVCSFEQAKELYRIGVLQESLYYYVFYAPNPRTIYLNPKKHATQMFAHALKKYGEGNIVEIRSAFNVSELALLLNLTEGIINAVALADILMLKMQSGELSLEEINQRMLSAI